MNLFIVIAILLYSIVVSSNPCVNPDKCKNYQGIVIGGGFSGISFTYYADLIKRLSSETGIKLSYNIDLSKVLLIESRSVLGGNARAKVADVVDPIASKRAQLLYNLSGDWLVDLGPQRVPQVTLKADRCTAIDSQTLQEFTPYKTYEYSRGRHVKCDIPDFSNYSPANIYGISGSCSNVYNFIGDPLINYTDLGPAYNVSNMQP